MQFAINYSPQAEKLWRAGQIQVDLFKCPNWPDLVARAGALHKVYVHCDLYAGRGEPTDADLDQLARWLETTETRAINTHFAVLRSELAAEEAATPETVVKRALRSIDLLGERFGNDRILIENLAYPTGFWQGDLMAEAVDPAVISEIVARSGCGLLLDLAHAILACEGTGRTDLRGYMNALPVHALRELHVVGILPEPDESGVRQDHFAMTEGDWQVAEWAVSQIRQGNWRRPDTLAFEYGGVGERFQWRSDEAVIAAQAPRLYQLAKSV